MSRPSYAPGRPRESVFIRGPLPQDGEPVSSPYIEACVAAAQETSDKLYHAHGSLRGGVSDLRRMGKVLENERLFALVNESHVALYQSQLADEVEPQILELIERAEKGVKLLERRETVMRTKLEAAHIRASSRASMGTLEAKRLDALTSQRVALDEEVKRLSDDIDKLERISMGSK